MNKIRIITGLLILLTFILWISGILHWEFILIPIYLDIMAYVFNLKKNENNIDDFYFMKFTIFLVAIERIIDILLGYLIK